MYGRHVSRALPRSEPDGQIVDAIVRAEEVDRREGLRVVVGKVRVVRDQTYQVGLAGLRRVVISGRRCRPVQYGWLVVDEVFVEERVEVVVVGARRGFVIAENAFQKKSVSISRSMNDSREGAGGGGVCEGDRNRHVKSQFSTQREIRSNMSKPPPLDSNRVSTAP